MTLYRGSVVQNRVVSEMSESTLLLIIEGLALFELFLVAILAVDYFHRARLRRRTRITPRDLWAAASPSMPAFPQRERRAACDCDEMARSDSIAA